MNTKSDYGQNQTNKRQPPKLSPDRPYWSPLLIVQKRNIVTATVFVELPLELVASPASDSTVPATVFVVFYEPRGLRNLNTLGSKTIKV